MAAKSVLLISHDPFGVALNVASAARWVAFDAVLLQAFSVRDRADRRFRNGGAIRNLKIGVGTNSRTTPTTFSVVVNGSPRLQVVVPAGGVGEFVSVGEGTLAAGDLVCIEGLTGSGSGSLLLTLAQVEYESSGPTTYFANFNSRSYTAGQGVGRFTVPLASYDRETIFQWNTGIPQVTPTHITGRVSAIEVNVASNSRNGPVTFRLVKNGVETPAVVTVPAGAIGKFWADVDVEVQPGDELYWLFDTTASSSGATGMFGMAATFESVDAKWEIMSALRVDGVTFAGMVTGDNVIGLKGSLAAPSMDISLPFDTTAVAWGYRGYYDAGGTPVKPTYWYFRAGGVNVGDSALPLGPGGGSNAEGLSAYFSQAVPAGTPVSLFVHKLSSSSNTIGIQTRTFTFENAGVIPPQEVAPPPGAVAIEGLAPTLVVDEFVAPAAGSLVLGGLPPLIVTNIELDLLPGALVLTGAAPSIFAGIMVDPAPEALVLSGVAPLVFTDFYAATSQQAVLAVGEMIPAAEVSQMAILAAGYVVPPAAVSQQAVLVIAVGGPCVTARCQIWTITRRDGEVFRYTSHDVDVRYGGEVYSACRSLNPSASENASTLGSVGNIELVGIIDDEGISEADLYGGKFDDAYVTVDLISWGAPVDVPRRLASGWTGQLSQGDTSFNMEVLGSSARLEQQALTQPFAPGCRWIFGDDRCGVDVEAMKLTGAVMAVGSRTRFAVDLSGDPAGRQWTNGRLRWTSGPNDGQVLEVKEVDFAAGLVTLWPSAALLPQVGDTFDLLPGCDKAKTGGCTVYANIINFGGFPDVPGEDALLETPNAQY